MDFDSKAGVGTKSLKTFMKQYKLQNRAASNKKISEVINKLGIKDFNIYMRDDKLTTKQGIINLHPEKGTHWACYLRGPMGRYFDSYGHRAPKSVENQLKPYIYSTYKIQGNKDSRCASYCLYILYLINIEKMDFDKAVMRLWFSK